MTPGQADELRKITEICIKIDADLQHLMATVDEHDVRLNKIDSTISMGKGIWIALGGIILGLSAVLLDKIFL